MLQSIKKFKHKPEGPPYASYILRHLWCLSTPMSPHGSMILVFGSFTARMKWLLAYFFLYFLCFEIFNNVKKLIAVSSELRPEIFSLKIRRRLLKLLNIFMMKYRKSSSFMLILKLAGIKNIREFS